MHFKVLRGDSLDFPVFYLLNCKIHPTGPICETDSPTNWNTDWEQPPLATNWFNAHHLCHPNLWATASSTRIHNTPQRTIHPPVLDFRAASPCSPTSSTCHSSCWVHRASAGSPSTLHPALLQLPSQAPSCWAEGQVGPACPQRGLQCYSPWNPTRFVWIFVKEKELQSHIHMFQGTEHIKNLLKTPNCNIKTHSLQQS